MPIYEYQCDSCGSQRELFLKSGDAARPTCSKCRKRMRRVISQTAFILKGKGWYVTDYPSEARKQGLEGEKAPPAADAAAAKKDAAAPKKDAATTEKRQEAPPPGAVGKKSVKAGKKHR